MMKTSTKFLYLTFIISVLVYFYNIIRFPLFNNDFDPWVHYASMVQMEHVNQLYLSAYNGFPGILIIAIYMSKAFNVDLFTIVQWMPLFSGVLSTVVAAIFIKHLINYRNFQTSKDRITEEMDNNVVIFGCLLNTTISLFSLISSGMFWGQMFTASLLPIIIIKLMEINSSDSNRTLLEYFLVTSALFFIHDLTSFLLITFLSFTQLYLLSRKKGSIKGTLIVFISVLLFLMRYETLSLNISIISSLTVGETNYFYWYFIALFAVFAILIGFKKIKEKITPRAKLPRQMTKLKKLYSTMLLMVIAGILLAVVFFAAILPFIYSTFTGLSSSWFLYYGSNLVLLAPISIAGVIVLGRLLNLSISKIVLYCWVLTIIIVLALLFTLYILKLGVGALTFGRLATFMYPVLSIFAAFACVPIMQQRRKIKPGARKRSGLIAKHARLIVQASMLGGFCILVPLSIVGFNPPPSATLTRYWNVPSEQDTTSWIMQHVQDGSGVNVDYHLLEMALYYEIADSKNISVESAYKYYFLNTTSARVMLAPGKNYLIVVDDVMLNDSLSFTGGNVEQGTMKPLGNALLVTYDHASFLNKIYCSDSQWLYQYYSA